MTKSRGINQPTHRWTKREERILRQRYAHERTADLAQELGLRLANVYAKATNMGLHKSAKFLATDKSGRIFKGGQLGQATQFKPGQVSHNKGKKGWCPAGAEKGWFKKGQMSPRNIAMHIPIGGTRINADGYLERKVSNSGRGAQRFKAEHRILWAKAHGPIPKSHLVVFRDGNRARVVLANLELITRAENSRRNVMWRRYPKELAHVLQLRGAINRQINRRLNRGQEKNRERREAERRVIRNARRASGQGKSDGHRAR